jgi:hypothetical protein
MSIDDEWLNFQENGVYEKLNKIDEDDEGKKNPKCSDIYISTQTKIAFLNSSVDLNRIFWELPVLEYHVPKNGIIKKQMKINCLSKEDVISLEEKIVEKNIKYDIISQVDNPNARKVKFKDIRKLTSGICSKDLTSYRKKQRGAFYNCFALILRILYKEKYKEIHVKVFNTGKLEIPGIQYDDLLLVTFDYLLKVLQPFYNNKLLIDKNGVDTVLINSNFSCNFFIDRNIFYNKLKYTYKLHVLYDPCSYPGIQCKFYYNKNKKIQNGVCECEKKCTKDKQKKSGKKNNCQEVSFMIFRTGSILIVGHCDKSILNIIYNFIKEILIKEHTDIYIRPEEKKQKNKKKRLKTFLIKVQ